MVHHFRARIKRLGMQPRNLQSPFLILASLSMILCLTACTGWLSQVAFTNTGFSETSLQPTDTLSLLSIRYITDTPTSAPFPTHTSTASPVPPTITPAPTLTLTPEPSATAAFFMCSPLETVVISDLPKIISDPFNPPPPGSDARHEGVDFAYYRWKSGGPIQGVPIQSILPGRVAAALADTFPYGNFVIIETPGEILPPALLEKLKIPSGKSLYALFAHMEKPPLVSLGEEVASCQHLGAVGKTGNANAAHLHLEARYGPPGAIFYSLSRFVEGATEEEKENYVLWRTSGVFPNFDPMKLLEADKPIAR